jgi:hypothetical protein
MDTLAIGDDKSLDFDTVLHILSRITLVLVPGRAVDEGWRGINNPENSGEVFENLIAFDTVGADRKKDLSGAITSLRHDSMIRTMHFFTSFVAVAMA